MDWKAVFAKLTTEAEQTTAEQTIDKRECLHTDVVEDADDTICSECGTILVRKFSAESQFSSTAVTRRRVTSCPIYEDIPDEFDPAVKSLAVTIYKTVTIRRIYKSTLRKAIIAACLYRASVLLDASTRRCFSSLGLSTTEANRGIVFVSTNLPQGEYNIPLFGDKSEICAACSVAGITGQNVVTVLNLFEKVKKNCEKVFMSSQRVSIVYGCVWTFIKCCSDETTNDHPSSLTDLINRLIAENICEISGKKTNSRAPVSAITIDRKHCEIMKYILSRILKRVFALCVSSICSATTLISTTPAIPITVYDCSDPDKISMVADDGFVYPLDDVDDVEDWNILFGMKYVLNNCKTVKRVIELPIRIISKSRSISVKFDDCSYPIHENGPCLLRNEIRKFIHKE